MQNALSWGRAVGRVLEVGPSELYMLGIIGSISTASELSELLPEISVLIGKIRAPHVSQLCSELCGIRQSLLSRQPAYSFVLQVLDTIRARVTEVQSKTAKSAPVSGSSTVALDSAESDLLLALTADLASFIRILDALPLPLHNDFRATYGQSTPTLQDTFLSVLLHDEVQGEDTAHLFALFTERCVLLNQELLPLPLMLTRAADALFDGHLDAASAAASLQAKASAVLTAETRSAFYTHLQSLLDSEDSAVSTETRLTVAKVFSASLPSTGASVRLLELHQILDDLHVHCDSNSVIPTRSIRTERSGGLVALQQCYYISEESDRETIVMNLLASGLALDEASARLLLRLVRLLHFSAYGDIASALDYWTEQLICADSMTPSYQPSEACVRCWRGLLQALRRRSDLEGLILEFFVVDVGVFASLHSGLAAGEVVEWTSGLSRQCQLHIQLVIGGARADDALRSMCAEELDALCLLLVPVTASPEALLASPHLPLILQSTRDRLHMADPGTPLFPSRGLAFSPLILLYNLLRAHCLHEALQLYWCLVQRPETSFEFQSALRLLQSDLHKHTLPRSLGIHSIEGLGWRYAEALQQSMLGLTSTAFGSMQ